MKKTQIILAMSCASIIAITSGGCGDAKKEAPDKQEVHQEHDGHDHSSHEGHDHSSHEGHDHGSQEQKNDDSHEGHDHSSHEGHNH